MIQTWGSDFLRLQTQRPTVIDIAGARRIEFEHTSALDGARRLMNDPRVSDWLQTMMVAIDCPCVVTFAVPRNGDNERKDREDMRERVKAVWWGDGLDKDDEP